MSVSVEKVSDVKRRLTIVVPANKVEEAYTIQINRFAKSANIKGFRPGKAPLSFIQQRFGEDARREAFSDVIENAFKAAIEETKLNPVSAPQVEPKAMLPNQPLEFVASFEVLPEIAAIKHDIKEIEKLVVEVSAEDIGHVVAQLTKQYTKWNMVERAAQAKDRVLIDYYAIFDGVEDLQNKVQNFPLELGSKVMLAGFEDGLMGAKAGEEHRLSLNFPADFALAERAGKPVDFVVQVQKVFEAHTPEINSSFIEKLGVKSGQEEDLHKQIRQSLEQERDRLLREKLKEKIFTQLLEQNPLEVPSALVERESKNIHDEIYPPHQHHDHHQHGDDEIKAFDDVAKKRVALGLLVAEYVKQTQLKVDQDRVAKRIQEIASVYEKPAEVIDWLSTREQRAGIEAQVMEDQVLDKIMENVPVIEKAMTYAELKGIQHN
jgi:trigger factor